MKKLDVKYKDKLVLLGWIAGLLLFISMIWIFTKPLQTYYLMRSVNTMLVNTEDSRRLSAYLPKKPHKAEPLGYWFSLHNSPDEMFVFTFFHEGINIPLGAIISANDGVREVIPLSAHAVQVFESLPQSVLQIYISRIEKEAKK
jgi:hypothetical protein